MQTGDIVFIKSNACHKHDCFKNTNRKVLVFDMGEPNNINGIQLMIDDFAHKIKEIGFDV